RPATLTGAPNRFQRNFEAREWISTIDRDTGEAITQRTLGDVVDGIGALERRGDGDPVVLANEEHRQAMDSGEIECFVRVPLGAGAVSVGGEDDVAFSSLPELPGDPSRMDKLSGEG